MHNGRKRVRMKWFWGVAMAFACGRSFAAAPAISCDMSGLGKAPLVADGGGVRILSVTEGKEGSVPYCLVKVVVPAAINIWVGLPMPDAWNGRWQSVGGGVYAGSVNVPADAIRTGYAAATTDTGHDGGARGALNGSFGMLTRGKPNTALQADFASRSEHLMAVVGKQLVQAFYGKAPQYAYWNGCSTGGRQGLRMAQDYPDDYDGILAAAPAIHWDRFQAAMLWYPVLQNAENGGPIGGANPQVLAAKYRLATDRAIQACDAADGVTDGLLMDPRRCGYEAGSDAQITLASCMASDPNCLKPSEAAVIDKSWRGPVACAAGDTRCDVPATASRKLGGRKAKRYWYGQLRGTDLSPLGGAEPFPVATEQAKYWVYFDPEWDWRGVTVESFGRFFRDSVKQVGPMMASDNPDLRAFARRGSKLVLWHGWSDQLINAQGTIDYYDRVARKAGGLARVQQFARLFMAPGVAHCAGGIGPQPQRPFEAVVDWVEKGIAPDRILASRQVSGTTQTRPLCPYPTEARWSGSGSTDDAANFSCVLPGR